MVYGIHYGDADAKCEEQSDSHLQILLHFLAHPIERRHPSGEPVRRNKYEISFHVDRSWTPHQA